MNERMISAFNFYKGEGFLLLWFRVFMYVILFWFREICLYSCTMSVMS